MLCIGLSLISSYLFCLPLCLIFLYFCFLFTLLSISIQELISLLVDLTSVYEYLDVHPISLLCIYVYRFSVSIPTSIMVPHIIRVFIDLMKVLQIHVLIDSPFIGKFIFAIYFHVQTLLVCFL
jgi:hypothetical protein